MRTSRILRPLLASAVVLTLSSTAALACFMRAPLPVQVWMDHIQVDITDQVAVKTYHCTFKNPNPRAIVGGTCYMELEPGAQVDNMSVLIDGVEHQAEILDADKAKQVFADIVRNGGSPALLEYFGNQLIQTQVPRVEAGGTVTVKLQYTTVLRPNGDVIRLQMLNTNPKALMQPLKSASVTVNIRSTRPIKNVYSPTHKLKFDEQAKWDVCLSWSQDDYLPRYPFVLYYQVADDKVGASVIAHKERGEEGAFMLMLSPTLGKGADAVREADILPKDVVFCIDTSGSMLEASKMTQARGALEYCVSSLREGDRFNIVDFSTTARSLKGDGLLAFDNRSKRQALEYVADLSARGGTAIEEALETSIRHLGDANVPTPPFNRGSEPYSRLKMIVFVTDGHPTIGEIDTQKLLGAVARENDIDARLFVFGAGYDVNAALLDFLALDNRGEADYILPDEDIDQKISRFFDRVGSPVMTDIEIDFGDLRTSEVSPRKIADIYRGEQVVIYGRYRGGGKHTVTVTGNINGGRRETFSCKLEFPRRSDNDKHAFVHRLWAGRRVDFLLSEIRKQPSAPQELVDEVTRLAQAVRHRHPLHQLPDDRRYDHHPAERTGTPTGSQVRTTRLRRPVGRQRPGCRAQRRRPRAGDRCGQADQRVPPWRQQQRQPPATGGVGRERLRVRGACRVGSGRRRAAGPAVAGGDPPHRHADLLPLRKCLVRERVRSNRIEDRTYGKSRLRRIHQTVAGRRAAGEVLCAGRGRAADRRRMAADRGVTAVHPTPRMRPRIRGVLLRALLVHAAGGAIATTSRRPSSSDNSPVVTRSCRVEKGGVKLENGVGKRDILLSGPLLRMSGSCPVGMAEEPRMARLDFCWVTAESVIIRDHPQCKPGRFIVWGAFDIPHDGIARYETTPNRTLFINRNAPASGRSGRHRSTGG